MRLKNRVAPSSESSPTRGEEKRKELSKYGKKAESDLRHRNKALRRELKN
jgi:hypothetical protein